MTLATWLTLGRILLVPFFITALIYYAPGKEQYRTAAFVIFLIASLTDMLDGIIARTLKQKSSFGTFLDPIADKMLVVSGYLGVFFSPAFVLKPPVWIVIVIVFRDLVIVAGLLLIFISSGRVRIQPNLIGKTTTFFQMATLASLLLILPISPVLWNITAALTIASGIIYVIREARGINGTKAA